MPMKLPQSVKKLLQDKAYGHVVTFNAQGGPQLTMVWMDVDGDEVTFNTAEGRRKLHNLRRDPRIVVSVQDRHEPQLYAVLHGTARVTEAGADEQIDKLAKRFLGVDKYPFRQPGEKRVIVRTSVDRISGFGPNMQLVVGEARRRAAVMRQAARAASISDSSGTQRAGAHGDTIPRWRKSHISRLPAAQSWSWPESW